MITLWISTPRPFTKRSLHASLSKTLSKQCSSDQLKQQASALTKHLHVIAPKSKKQAWLSAYSADIQDNMLDLIANRSQVARQSSPRSRLVKTLLGHAHSKAHSRRGPSIALKYGASALTKRLHTSAHKSKKLTLVSVYGAEYQRIAFDLLAKRSQALSQPIPLAHFA